MICFYDKKALKNLIAIVNPERSGRRSHSIVNKWRLLRFSCNESLIIKGFSKASINKMILVLAVVLFLQVSCRQNARGQSLNKKNAVFVDVSVGTFALKNSFTKEFTPSPAFRLGLRFPFLTGQLEGGVRFQRFNGHANTEVNSDFHSFFIYAGYYYPFHITDWYAVGPALRVGYNLIYYNQTKVYTMGSFRYETDPVDGEFSYELALRNQFKISRHWFLHASIFYNHTYTKIPLPLTMVSLGFSYAFSEPAWLKTFLR